MKKTLRRFFRYLGIVILIFFILTIIVTMVYRFADPPITPLMILRSAEYEEILGEPLVKQKWIPLEEFPDHLVLAVILSEDRNFFRHSGFDIRAIRQAYYHNRKGGKTLGASTISQQTAKNVFLWPGRSWPRKILEGWFTLLIEHYWGKKRIMEVYLNVIETGEGIYGIETASEEYFGKPARLLTKNEAALLAVILPNPREWASGNLTKYQYTKQQWILKQLEAMGKNKPGTGKPVKQ